MTIILLAALAGFVAGLRTFLPLAAVSWAASLGWLDLSGSWLAFLGHWVAPWILTLLAVGELVVDKRSSTPSRKAPGPFGSRLLSAGVSGAAIGLPSGLWVAGLVVGVVGALVGTLGGFEARGSLVAATGGRDWPVALIEDAIAILFAIIIVVVLSEAV